MSKTPEPTPALNRLRAAAGLIPLIEDGLRQSRITAEKASLMAEFCSWAAQQGTEGGPEALRLADDIKAGLERLRASFYSVMDNEKSTGYVDFMTVKKETLKTLLA